MKIGVRKRWIYYGVYAFFLFVIVGILGKSLAPEILSAADVVKVRGIRGDVQTVISDEPAMYIAEDTFQTTEIVAELASAINVTSVVYVEPVVHVAPMAAVSVAPVERNFVMIGGREIPLAYTDNTLEDAGSVSLAWYYGNGKFIYGHNSWNVFGFLETAYNNGGLIGVPAEVRLDGASQYYTVTDAVVYDYDPNMPNKLSTLSSSGIVKTIPMANAIIEAKAIYYNEVGRVERMHRLAIMTCYDGGRKRLVTFLD